MFGIINFETFIIAGLLLNLTPGVDTMYILSRSISQGKKAGIYSAVGIATGALFHVLFATLGLSIILAQSAFAFGLIKYLGAAYLIYLGIKILTNQQQGDFKLEQEADQINHRKIYVSGILTNILNPKVALFFYCFFTTVYQPFL